MADSDTSVIIVHPAAEIRQAIRAACDSVRLPTVAYQTAGEFLAAAPEPGGIACLVMGMRIPGANAPELLAELARRNRALPAILVTAHPDVSSTIEVMKLGAIDVFEAPASPLQLIDAIHRALRMARLASEARRHYTRLSEALTRLSGREREVLHQLLAGRNNKAVAQSLGLSEKTIASHRNNILLKMGHDSLVELTGRLYPVLAMPQIFLNPWAVNPVDLLPALLDSSPSSRAA